MKNKKILFLCLAMFILLQSLSYSSTIKASDWSKDVLIDMYENEFIKDLSIDFKKEITRKDFMDYLIPSLERILENSFEEPTERYFLDVPKSDSVNINKAYELGIIQGKNEVHFEPEESLTREQAAIILVKTLDMLGRKYHLSEEKKDSPLVLSYKNRFFLDENLISSWAYGYVVIALNNEIMEGTASNVFSPQNPLTVEQAIVTINRLVNHINTNAQRTLIKKHHKTLGTSLESTLILAKNMDLIISIDLLSLYGKTEREAEALLGRASHEGRDLETTSKLLVYPLQGLLLKIKDHRVAGFSVDNSLSNDFFKGKIGDQGYSSDIAFYQDQTHTREEVFNGQTISYQIYAFFSGKDFVELVWDENGTYMGLVYRFTY